MIVFLTFKKIKTNVPCISIEQYNFEIRSKIRIWHKTPTLVRDPKSTKHARIIVNSVFESLSHDIKEKIIFTKPGTILDEI